MAVLGDCLKELESSGVPTELSCSGAGKQRPVTACGGVTQTAKVADPGQHQGRVLLRLAV